MSFVCGLPEDLKIQSSFFWGGECIHGLKKYKLRFSRQEVAVDSAQCVLEESSLVVSFE